MYGRNFFCKKYIYDYLSHKLQGFRSIYNGPNTAYTVTKLAPFSRYLFRLTATNQQGPSPASPSIEATTRPSAPAAPAAPIMTDKALTDSFAVEWIASRSTDMVTAYTLQLAVRSTAEPTFTTIYHGPDLSAHCPGLKPGTTYVLRLQAHNDGGASTWSKNATLSTAAVAPGPPGLRCSLLRPFLTRMAIEEPAWNGGAAISMYR